ncbi:hypothetical protein B0H14DRAFT_2621932 [Mycena olivaceomarginata]|nr:hypothetical protein B0H14DRAFT_2621932 [Mycena olivaceomarginata]
MPAANATAAPLAASLGLVPDTHCGTGDNANDDCVGDALKKYAKNSTQSILIVWDANEMDDLLRISTSSCLTATTTTTKMKMISPCTRDICVDQKSEAESHRDLDELQYRWAGTG